MDKREAANIIIALRNKGWNDAEINDFVVFVETNIPTMAAAEDAKKNQKN